MISTNLTSLATFGVTNDLIALIANIVNVYFSSKSDFSFNCFYLFHFRIISFSGE